MFFIYNFTFFQLSKKKESRLFSQSRNPRYLSIFFFLTAAKVILFSESAKFFL
jgi:hypothetical protein